METAPPALIKPNGKRAATNAFWADIDVDDDDTTIATKVRQKIRGG